MKQSLEVRRSRALDSLPSPGRSRELARDFEEEATRLEQEARAMLKRAEKFRTVAKTLKARGRQR